MSDDDTITLVELMRDLRVAMFTTSAEDGSLEAVPMARQEVEPSAELWFITARDSRHVRNLQARPAVGLTFSSNDAWVSIHGTATLVEDQARLEEYWSTFAEAWLPGGPDDPNAALIRVDAEGGEYWDSPGGRVATLLSLAKTRLTGETYDTEHGTAEL